MGYPKDWPTAVHVLFDARHAVEAGVGASGRRGGLCACCIDHLVPFHRATSGVSMRGTTVPHEPHGRWATLAVQAVADAQDTPVRNGSVSRTVSEMLIGSIDQVAPFHRSAKSDNPGPWVPSICPSLNPTAVQAVGEVHDTPVRIGCCDVGLAVGRIDQRLPFQRSTSGRSPPLGK